MGIRLKSGGDVQDVDWKLQLKDIPAQKWITIGHPTHSKNGEMFEAFYKAKPPFSRFFLLTERQRLEL